MSDDQSARLGLPYLAAGQMQKHVTLNEALTRLDALTQAAVVSRSVAAQPADPPDGTMYILPPSPSGAAWSGLAAGDLVRFEAGGWAAVDRPEGLAVLVLDEAATAAWIDGAWVSIGGAGELDALQDLSLLGVGTTADAVNPFAAKLNKALWTARGTGEGGDGDLRYTLNKSATGNTLSLLFQSGWSGRAELGLVGDDDLTLKVSPDGAAWTEVMVVEAATGAARFAKGAARIETTALTADGGWTPPAWARWIAVTAIGGGGGGGAGMTGWPTTNRFGGGGGGGGGVSQAMLPAAAVAAGLAAVIGTGGAGATAAGGSGADGGDSRLTLGGTTILTARGGKGGAGGSAASGLGGKGGQGDVAGAAGGDSAADAAADPGQAGLAGPGGGGAGGGLTSTAVAHAGGAGGQGASLRTAAAGGAAGAAVVGGAGSASGHPSLSRAGAAAGGGAAPPAPRTRAAWALRTAPAAGAAARASRRPARAGRAQRASSC